MQTGAQVASICAMNTQHVTPKIQAKLRTIALTAFATRAKISALQQRADQLRQDAQALERQLPEIERRLHYLRAGLHISAVQAEHASLDAHLQGIRDRIAAMRSDRQTTIDEASALNQVSAPANQLVDAIVRELKTTRRTLGIAFSEGSTQSGEVLPA